MSTRQGARARSLIVLLLVLALPRARAAAAAAPDVVQEFQTLDGASLDIVDPGSTGAPSKVLLQRCTVTGAGLTVSGATTADTAGSNPIAIRILDTTVADATLTFHGYTPGNSLVHVVNMTATMEGSTPLFNVQGFYLSVGDGSSMMMQRVRATWNSAPGGSVLLLGGSESLTTLSGKVFTLSEAVVTGAAHVLELVAGNTCLDCVNAIGGLIAFDLVEFHEPRGAFVHSGVVGPAFASSGDGMVRFSNITVLGDQAFFEAENAKDAVVYNGDEGNIVFSGITTSGSLFDFKDDSILVSASGASLKYTLRHIHVKAVVSSSTYSKMVPAMFESTAVSTWNFYMGNVTVDGTLRDTINMLNAVQLFPTQVMDAYGNVQEVAGSPYPIVDLNAPTAAYCVTGRDGSAGFVDLVPGVQRAECNCNSPYNAPYCTDAVDPLVYYDAYSPSPATCDVDNCDTCLFGQASQCGACALGYMLTAALGCTKLTCLVDKCTSCQLGSSTVCSQCADGYSWSDDQRTCVSCDIAGCDGCTADNVCSQCADGYTLSDNHSTCFFCGIANCNACTAKSVCGACTVGYSLSYLKTTCFSCNISNCAACTADSVCTSCAKDYKLMDTGECKKKGVGWWVWLIVGIAAAVVLAGVIVLVVCCVRHRRRGQNRVYSSYASKKADCPVRRNNADVPQNEQCESRVNTGASAPDVTTTPSQSPLSESYEWSLTY